MIEGLCDATDKGKLYIFARKEIINRENDNIATKIQNDSIYIQGVKYMKICIPTEEQKGLESLAYGHFGSAPYFFIYDTVAKDFEILNNNEAEHEHGQCNPIQPLREKGVTAVLVAGMGARALMNLQSMGIKVFRTTDTMTVKDIILNLDTLKMEKLTIENSCQHHNCH